MLIDRSKFSWLLFFVCEQAVLRLPLLDLMFELFGEKYG